MIYIKNIGEVQTIYIPRNELLSETYVVTNKNCEYCYNEGLNDGIGKQKDKLTVLSVSENGLYEREDGWHTVDVNIKCKADNKQEKNITITQEFDTVLPDEGYDSLSKVDINASEYGNQKHLEGYNTGKVEGAEEGYTQGKRDGYDEGYDIGKVDGYNEGYNTGKVDGREDVYLIGFESAPSWEKRDENNRVKYKASEYGADGFSSVTIDIGTVYEEGHLLGKTEGFEAGYNSGYEEGITEQKSKLENIEITVNGTYTKEDGYGSVVVKVPDVNGSYDEGYTDGKSDGYEEGYADGKAEGGDKINVSEMGIKFAYSTFTEIPPYYEFKDGIDMSNMFYKCEYLILIPLLDTSNVKNMSYMFYGCGNLTNIPLLDTSNVSDMDNMFSGCNKLTTIPLLDTSNVSDMQYMFAYCESLTTIPELNTRRAFNMRGMFDGCYNLTAIPQLDTSNVRYMDDMFNYCESLTSIPQLDTSNVTSMSQMFSNCTSLISVPPLNASKLLPQSRDIFGREELPKLTDFGGLIGLKINMTTDGFVNTPNLTYESCINVLNGLYDFTGNGVQPTVNEGRLKVHQNFLDLVGDNISIATNRGWIITA